MTKTGAIFVRQRIFLDFCRPEFSFHSHSFFLCNRNSLSTGCFGSVTKWYFSCNRISAVKKCIWLEVNSYCSTKQDFFLKHQKNSTRGKFFFSQSYVPRNTHFVATFESCKGEFKNIVRFSLMNDFFEIIREGWGDCNYKARWERKRMWMSQSRISFFRLW